MEKQNLISIIVPVYNVAAYIRQCLDSLLGQSYPYLDIILVDDGSTDCSGQICDEYAYKDSRIRVIHQQNEGAANAKNAGLDLASGDFITFLDSDDWVEPDWIHRMLCTALKENSDIVECKFRREYIDHAEEELSYNSMHMGTWDTESYLRSYPNTWTCAIFWNKLFRASLIFNVRFHKERRCIDDEFFTYKAITGASKIVRINDELYHYRQRKSSVMRAEHTLYQRTIDDIDILAERYCWMKRFYPNLALYYLRHDISTMLYFARNLPFTDEAVLTFKKNSKFYLHECFQKYPGKVTLFYAVKIALFSRKNLLARRIENMQTVSYDSYYV